MLRKALVLVLLLSPQPLLGQSGEARQGSGSVPSPETQVFLETFRYIRNYHLGEFTDSTLWEMAIEGLIAELDDPYAVVFTPEEVEAFREGTTGNYAGIGVQITGLNDEITITAVFRGTPAERAGIIVGDRIVGVGEKSVEGWSTGAASDEIRGEVGTTVRVVIRRDGITEPIPHDIQRDSVHVGAVTAEVLEGNLGYVLMDRVARNSAAEMDSALAVLSGSEGLIIDVRRNPGGYLDEALALADLFLDEGDVLLTTKGRNPGRWGSQAEEVARGRMPARVPDLPVIVLVDEYSASASEILAGALQDHDRALVLGDRTFGKGLVQTILPLPYGRQVRLTTAEWFTPLGRSLHRPRDRENRLLPEATDSLPTYASSGGRTLQGGGGVFPDLTIADDTLTLSEREFLNAAARAEIPLAVRVQEFAFEQSQLTRRGEAPEPVSEEAFEGFLASLVAEGLEPGSLDDPDAGNYLDWRVRMAFFERLERLDRAFEIRAERDVVLARAMELLGRASSQSELFAAAARLGAEESTAARQSTGEPGSR
jgi:carboxyl-terminal processing protease